ncbi:hypothetical protein CY35_20G019000 [Sphagnum magellanicum]|nr:hypothetical protein CY35_20G019000 [Sphagnum magellanicum]
MGRMWVMVVHHCLLHRSSAGSTSFEEVELDEDSTQAMKRYDDITTSALAPTPIFAPVLTPTSSTSPSTTPPLSAPTSPSPPSLSPILSPHSTAPAPSTGVMEFVLPSRIISLSLLRFFLCLSLL